MTPPTRPFLAALATVFLLVAPAPWAAAQGPVTATGPEDWFRLSGRVGLQVLDYREEFGDIESEYTSVGPALGVTARLRLTERLRVTGDYLGAFIAEQEESWDNIRTGASAQDNDLGIDFHVLDLDVGYALVRTPRVEWAVVAGWHYYAQDFTRSQFRRGGDIQNLGPVDEDVRGQGVKLGTVLEGRLGDRLGFTGSVAGYSLYRVDIDNARHGEFDSDGVALRFGLALDYAMTPQVVLGLGYEGHLIAVDGAQNSRGILPENRTQAHTVSGRVAVRF
jgi:hypothetical protein